PRRLVLDGQQRLTSLFQATLFGKVVETVNERKQPIKRLYYIDIEKALASPEDREEAIVSVPGERVRKNLRGEVELDLTTNKQEYSLGLFPCGMIFDPADWRFGFNEHWNRAAEKVALFDRFEREILRKFQQYQLPVITLTADVEKEAVCHV